MTPIEKLLTLACAETGYLEKASTAAMDEKTANAGDANITRYARDMDTLGYYNGRKQGLPWCAVFADWCFVQAFGKQMAQKVQYQPAKGQSAGCNSAMNYFKAKGALWYDPQPGDRIFFWSSESPSEAGHTGIVVKADNKKVYTVEGNTSDGKEVIPNGGAVCQKSYA